jgi:hypothetical protein
MGFKTALGKFAKTKLSLCRGLRTTTITKAGPVSGFYFKKSKQALLFKAYRLNQYKSEPTQ